ncbi:MAG: hypothetical protein J6X54_00965 [Treponema sp.]|nr:hypothetical protein [Treponema sp.]
MKKIICGICALGLTAAVIAQVYTAKTLVDPKYYDTLVKNGEVKVIHEEGKDELLLLPKTEYTSAVKANRVKKGEKNFPFVFESLFLIKKDFLKTQSKSTDTNINIEDVSRIFRSVSKMEGMKYYSYKKGKPTGKEKVLYKKAYTISSPDSKEKIADKTSGSADGKVIYCLQDDSSFGVCRYRLDYKQKENLIYATFTSTDSMGIGPITAIEPGDLKINILVADCGDSLLLWLSTDTNCKKLPGIKDQVTESMQARMDAVYKWFIKQF